MKGIDMRAERPQASREGHDEGRSSSRGAPRYERSRASRYGAAPKKRAPKPVRKRDKHVFNVKLFNRWDTNVPVNDPSLKGYINLEPRIIPRSAGSQRGRFHKSRMHIVERLAAKRSGSGHTGNNHK